MAASILLLPLILLSLFISTTMSIKDSVLSSVCSNTVNPAFCMEAFKADPRTARSDLHGLGHISVDLARSKAVATLRLVQALNRRPATTDMKQKLASCTRKYGVAIGQLDGAKRHLGKGNYGGVAIAASTAMEKAEDCQDEFEVPPRAPPALDRNNREMESFCNMVFNVAGVLA